MTSDRDAERLNPDGYDYPNSVLYAALDALQAAERERDEAREDSSRWLLRVSAIREASAVGVLPMLADLPQAIADKIAASEARAQSAEAALLKAREALESDAIYDAIENAAYDRRALGGSGNDLRPGLVVVDLNRAAEDVRSALFSRTGLTAQVLSELEGMTGSAVSQMAPADADLGAEPAGAWRPVESAPRDGTRFLGLGPIPRDGDIEVRETCWAFYGRGSLARAAFARGEGPSGSWRWSEPIHNWASSWSPTHWMPLPSPPNGLTPSEGDE